MNGAQQCVAIRPMRVFRPPALRDALKEHNREQDRHRRRIARKYGAKAVSG